MGVKLPPKEQPPQERTPPQHLTTDVLLPRTSADPARSPDTRVVETNFRESQLSSSSRRVSFPGRPPSWDRLGPLRVPLEAKLSGNRAVAIPIVAVRGFVAVSLCQ